MDTLTLLSKVTDGLLFVSEADYPLEPFIWTDPEPFSPDVLYKLAGLPESTLVTKEDVGDFFAPMLQTYEGATAVDHKRVARFRTLVWLLRQYLSDVAVYKLGTVEMPTYIVGRLDNGTIAGLHTTVVET